MRYLFYPAVIMLFIACHSTKKAESASPKPEASSESQAANNSSTTAVSSSSSDKNTGTIGGPETIVITFERTVCFGTCPAFTMTLNAETNKATYIGTSNIDKIGTYEKNISDEEIMKLKAEFDKAKFFDMQNEYTSEITDIPSTYVSLSVNGKTKKVKDRHHAPKELKDLEILLDKIANSEGWEKVKEQE